ncbi:MAG: hypothetical protein JSS02_04050 [Planctomycetes bacterium]|nr:hypothetical protein [Planctomycetota bacterium]
MMAKSERNTVGERLYWCYANLAMAEMATTDRAEAYGRLHYMVRARLYKGLRTGSMAAGSLMRDQAVRMKLPQECVYCGSVQYLSIDHIVPVNRGGDDGVIMRSGPAGDAIRRNRIGICLNGGARRGSGCRRCSWCGFT